MNFSIIIPTFQNYQYLSLCIKSIQKNSSFDHEIIVHLNGEIDMEVADKARQTILPLIEAGHDVDLNLSKVTYMDSSGISVLIESKKLSEEKKTNFELKKVHLDSGELF